MTSGYKLIIGFLIIIVLSLLWIPTNEVFNIIGGIFNEMATNSETISRNNMAIQIFYYSLFFFIIVISIWILKPKEENEYLGYIYEK